MVDYNECAVLKEHKYRKLKVFKSSNKVNDLNEYKLSRKEFKNFCKSQEYKWKESLKQKLVFSRTDPAAFWKIVKSINVQHLQPPDITPREWFEYFEKLLNQEVQINELFAEFVDDYTETHNINCKICAGEQAGNEEVQLLNKSITSEEIVKCIKDISNGKAPGIDGIVIEMLSHHFT